MTDNPPRKRTVLGVEYAEAKCPECGHVHWSAEQSALRKGVELCLWCDSDEPVGGRPGTRAWLAAKLSDVQYHDGIGP